MLRHKNFSTTGRCIKSLNQDLRDTLKLLSTTKIPESHIQKEKRVNQNIG